MISEDTYRRLSSEYCEAQKYNRHLLSDNTDLRIENAKLKKELELYKAFSTDVSHKLVEQALKRKRRRSCRK